MFVSYTVGHEARGMAHAARRFLAEADGFCGVIGYSMSPIYGTLKSQTLK
jgi:hypothetical protein